MRLSISTMYDFPFNIDCVAFALEFCSDAVKGIVMHALHDSINSEFLISTLFPHENIPKLRIFAHIASALNINLPYWYHNAIDMGILPAIDAYFDNTLKYDIYSQSELPSWYPLLFHCPQLTPEKQQMLISVIAQGFWNDRQHDTFTLIPDWHQLIFLEANTGSIIASLVSTNQMHLITKDLINRENNNTNCLPSHMIFDLLSSTTAKPSLIAELIAPLYFNQIQWDISPQFHRTAFLAQRHPDIFMVLFTIAGILLQTSDFEPIDQVAAFFLDKSDRLDDLKQLIKHCAQKDPRYEMIVLNSIYSSGNLSLIQWAGELGAVKYDQIARRNVARVHVLEWCLSQDASSLDWARVDNEGFKRLAQQVEYTIHTTKVFAFWSRRIQRLPWIIREGPWQYVIKVLDWYWDHGRDKMRISPVLIRKVTSSAGNSDYSAVFQWLIDKCMVRNRYTTTLGMSTLVAHPSETMAMLRSDNEFNHVRLVLEFDALSVVRVLPSSSNVDLMRWMFNEYVTNRSDLFALKLKVLMRAGKHNMINVLDWWKRESGFFDELQSDIVPVIAAYNHGNAGVLQWYMEEAELDVARYEREIFTGVGQKEYLERYAREHKLERMLGYPNAEMLINCFLEYAGVADGKPAADRALQGRQWGCYRWLVANGRSAGEGTMEEARKEGNKLTEYLLESIHGESG